ncbi:threonine transporter RhtB [Psychromonas sp. Urea-02u-13]|nr:threonine transporter RhtB [Psychromonas sp. Urea-02u-13]
MDTNLLLLFIPTFFAVSITPGLCMTLALTLGMTIGVRRSLWMMLGELAGVALVATSSLVGISALLLAYPSLFLALKYLGGAYLIYLAIQLWLSRGKMAMNNDLKKMDIAPSALISQGFVTAIVNPKGWAFFIALLPPFINESQAFIPQATILISIILCFEFICMLLYASGGKVLRNLLQEQGNVKIMNRIAATMMFTVALWLILS